MSGVMIALISGALMSIQGVFNTEVTKATSLWVSTSFVQLTALIVCLLAWAFTDRQSFLTLMEVPNKWTLLGVVIGAFTPSPWRPEHGRTWGLPGGDAHRDFPAHRGLGHRTFRLVWRGAHCL